jgi:hypothetical protein
MEACAAAGRITTAGEMNGFLKPRDPIVSNPLVVDRGDVVIPAGYVPCLDRYAVDAQTVASAPRLSQLLELSGAA